MKQFFDSVRGSLFGGKLTQSQVDGMVNILGVINCHNLLTTEKAYILATIYHETGREMQPVKEVKRGETRTYGRWQLNSNGVKYCPKNGTKNAAVYTFDEYPHLYYGRGDVQLTWFDNYKLASRKLNVDFLSNPDLVLEPTHSINITMFGMMEGWFTGRKLSNYITSTKTDYVNARRIVNGTDKASTIAGYAVKFEKALKL